MRHEEYLQHKRDLEERHRAGIELLEAAYQAEMQALETLRAASGARSQTARPQTAVAAAPAPSPAGKPVVIRHAPGELAEQVLAALPHLPETFDKNDLGQILTGTPNRASLYRVLQQLVDEGVLAQIEFGSGRRVSTYRKTATGR